MNLLEDVAKNRRAIKYEVLTPSLSELISMCRNDPPELEIHPKFQRLFRWSRAQQTSFVESLILEIPVPPIFVFERENDGFWELLDGLQRLSTIIKFMGQQIDVPENLRENDNEWHYENEHSLEHPLQLLEGEYLKSLSGLSYLRLPSQLQINLKRCRLQVYVLKRETDPTYKYEVFKRLNRGGARLEDQELRNCSIRLLDEKFPDFLIDLSSNNDFKICLGPQLENSRNGQLEEMALRYLAMKNWVVGFHHDVYDFLTKYMEGVASKKISFDYDLEKNCFVSCWKLLHEAFPEGDVFRGRSQERPSGPFSTTMFELASIAITSNLQAFEQLSLQERKDSIFELFDRARAKEFTGGGSNSRRKTRGRVELALSFFK